MKISDEGIRGRGVSMRALHPDDITLLRSWFSDPTIVLYWGGRRLSKQEIQQTYFSGRDDDLTPLIVEENGNPVGYIQAWSKDDRSGGIDIVLVADARGRGLGVDAVRTLAEWLLRDQRWSRVTVDPLADNARAIRAFAKAGFVTEAALPDAPEGPALLMAFQG